MQVCDPRRPLRRARFRLDDLSGTQGRGVLDVLRNRPGKEPRYCDYGNLATTHSGQLNLDVQVLVHKFVRYQDLAIGFYVFLDGFDLAPVKLSWANKGRHHDCELMNNCTGLAHASFMARYGEAFDNFGYDPWR